jgi:hypothetical protein
MSSVLFLMDEISLWGHHELTGPKVNPSIEFLEKRIMRRIMPNVNDTGDRATKRIRRIARIWGTLIIALALLILIGYAWSWVTTGKADPHAAEDYPPIENLPPLLGLLSILGLGVAWRWEGPGAAITIVFNLVGLPVLLIHWPITHDFPRYLVAPYGPWMIIAIPGILFLICWWRSKKRAIPQYGA